MNESSKGNYDLLIGNHLLKGKISELPKPIIMTQKIIEGTQIFHKIVAVIKRKILFSGRPTPLRLNQSANFFGGPASKVR
jgi:hypothetical protein